MWSFSDLCCSISQLPPPMMLFFTHILLFCFVPFFYSSISSFYLFNNKRCQGLVFGSGMIQKSDLNGFEKGVTTGLQWKLKLLRRTEQWRHRVKQSEEAVWCRLLLTQAKCSDKCENNNKDWQWYSTMNERISDHNNTTVRKWHKLCGVGVTLVIGYGYVSHCSGLLMIDCRHQVCLVDLMLK